MLLEVIALTAADVIAAQQAGAHRIELVSAIEQDGLSPTLETIESVLVIATIPVRVMVRFHHPDFVYTPLQVQTMLDWMQTLQTYPIDGFVLGALTPDNTIDRHFLTDCQSVIGSKKCTFHRAFDEVYDQQKALATLLDYHFIDTVLTSGGKQAPILDNLDGLVALQQAAPQIHILAGGGVNQTFIAQCRHRAIQHFHVGRAARVNQDFNQPISADNIACLLAALEK